MSSATAIDGLYALVKRIRLRRVVFAAVLAVAGVVVALAAPPLVAYGRWLSDGLKGDRPVVPPRAAQALIESPTWSCDQLRARGKRWLGFDRPLRRFAAQRRARGTVHRAAGRREG